jgi:ribosome biogenesis GTPase
MIDIREYGYKPKPDVDELAVARIVAVHKERYEIVCAQGFTYARLKSSIYLSGKELVEFPTTGDFVRIQYNDCGDSQIIRTLDRTSCFTRRDPAPGGGEQAEAANFDYVFILTSLNHDYNVKRLERYLTLAWQSGGVPVVVLTKADLVDDYADQLRQTELIAAGVSVLAVSAKTGCGLDSLSGYLGPRETVVFLGSSGVGKSSLINALAGEEVMQVAEIREDDSKGRHTTTLRRLIKLPGGAMVIDTPGMRQMGMWDVTEGIGEAFSDVEACLGRCRFTDCTHGNEPGCAIRAAIADGSLSAERWQDYLKLKREARYSDDREGYLRGKREWAKSIARLTRQRQKHETR